MKKMKFKAQKERCKICGAILYEETGNGICAVCEDDMMQIDELSFLPSVEELYEAVDCDVDDIGYC